MSLLKIANIGTWGDEYISFNYFYVDHDERRRRLSKEYWNNQTKLREPIDGDQYYFYFKFFTRDTFSHNYLDFRLSKSLYHVIKRINLWESSTPFSYSAYHKLCRTWRVT